MPLVWSSAMGLPILLRLGGTASAFAKVQIE
jgi:hypothetical protein